MCPGLKTRYHWRVLGKTVTQTILKSHKVVAVRTLMYESWVIDYGCRRQKNISSEDEICAPSIEIGDRPSSRGLKEKEEDWWRCEKTSSRQSLLKSEHETSIFMMMMMLMTVTTTIMNMIILYLLYDDDDDDDLINFFFTVFLYCYKKHDTRK
jgi:hypothetical protein